MPEAITEYQREVLKETGSRSLALFNDTDFATSNLRPVLTKVSDSNITFEPKRKSQPTRYDFTPSKDAGERIKPVADLFSQVTFTLGMPVILAAGADLMMHNKNLSFTKGTLNLYKNTAVGVTKAGWKGTSKLYKDQVKPRSKKAWKAFWEPLEKEKPHGK